MKKMNKKVFLIAGVLLSVSMTYGQVGIGSPVPRGALDINKKDGDKYSYDMGLVLPTNAASNNIKNAVPNNAVAPGTIFYDSTKDCVRLKQTADWSDCIGNAETAPLGVIQTLDCNNATINGTFAANVYSYGTFKIPYTGGNGKSYPAVSVSSSGVTGLTATLAPGTFENGNGTLTFVVSGIPSGEGQAIFVISVGGKTCTLLVDVVGNMPGITSSKLTRIGYIGAWTLNSSGAGDADAYPNVTVNKDGNLGYVPFHLINPLYYGKNAVNGYQGTEGISFVKLGADIGAAPRLLGKLSYGSDSSSGFVDRYNATSNMENGFLRNNVDVINIGWYEPPFTTSPGSAFDVTDRNNLEQFLKDGGVIINMANSYSHSIVNIKDVLGLPSAFPFVSYVLPSAYYMGHTAVVNKEFETAPFGAVPPGTELAFRPYWIAPTNINKSGYYYYSKDQLQPFMNDMTVYASLKGYPDIPVVWTYKKPGYKGVVINVMVGILNPGFGNWMSGTKFIDTAQEKFIHNMIAFAIEKSKGS